jgi:hypothetical protein
MGRFMTQLFGSKKEPWVGGDAPGERTEITVEPAGEGQGDLDNEKTSVVSPRDLPPDLRAEIESASSRPPRADTAQTSDEGPQAPDAWQQNDRTYEARSQARAAPQHLSPPPKQSGTMPGAGPQMMMAPHLPPPIAPQPYLPNNPPLIPSQEISDVGARPLVDDPKLGWQTDVANQLQNPGGSSTRLQSDPAADNFRIKSNTGWILLAVFLLLGTAGAIAAIVLY